MRESDSIEAWLWDVADRGGSDLHLLAGYPPIRREHGELIPMRSDELDAQSVSEILREICPPEKLERFDRERNVDFALELDRDQPTRDEPVRSISTGDRPNRQRFRVNLFYSGEFPGACIRVIPAVIPNLEWSNFPSEQVERLAAFRNGLIVFSGVTGSGKTTSMAMMVQRLIQQSPVRVVTIEDPIEYRFPRVGSSVISQREVGRDVGSFAEGLKYAMRQDPDIILVGEIRDQETARMAMSAAETGHLVLTTLHTRDAKGAVTRLIDLFPTHNHSETCSMLSISLRAVVSQHLLPSVYPGEKRELALEVMFNTNPVAAAIRMGRMDSLDNAILTGRKEGMITLDESVKRLYKAERISQATAERFVSDKDLLRR